ncbi:transcriptional regulator swi6 [Saxophila tyrrhenica]|uniref:Transcriptional regulator swi6 n=1 Tax=Saxophila tyrrhenica TaxID=1690608 RepID=A0AAV9PQ50_9PEZI|nr:transcriptional regulator swi6 [Saxophila tyrrhenica]
MGPPPRQASSPPYQHNPLQQPPPSSYGNSYNMSFEHNAPSYSHSFPTQSQQGSFGASNGPVSQVGASYSRSFGGGNGGGSGGRPYAPVNRVYEQENTQIYTAVYSGVSVYEMEVNGIACMRRRSDGWLNATQILKVAGVDKGKRTKVLEKEILTGEHEKVQGGYGKYQGTWISYRRGREFCRQYGVEDILRPLLDYDVSSDGSGGQGQQDTPTKEQAMAANRKRFYNPSVESQRSNGGPVTNGTFFQNISPTTSVALAAMNKAARLNSPGPRPSGLRRPSQQDAYPGGSQQSMISDGSFNVDVKHDSGFSTQPNGPNGEPPRKRMRPDSRDGVGHGMSYDASMRSSSPTEPNESFYFDASMPQELASGNGEPVALQPLPNASSEAQQDKMALVLDLFAEAGRTDYTNHPALSQLSGEDFNIPLDASANNALHWAATLAKVSLLKLLIQKGANIYRGNAAGQSPLISAVLVNNCWEHSCFPELLEVLGPLIEVRDLQGRTILHHIAVSSGIKGRAPSSKYYLEALLEFLVRIGTHPGFASGSAAQVAASAVANMQAKGDAMALSQDVHATSSGMVNSSRGAVSLVRFLSHIVNARDKAGNTALNLVARIGNQSIIKQLLEINADPALPNYKGVSAKDFGVGEQVHDNGGFASQRGTQNSTLAPYTQQTQESNADGDVSMVSNVSQTEDLSQDVISSITNMLTASLTTHKDILRARTEQIDVLNSQIQELSTLQKQELEHVQALKDRVNLRSERQAKVANLKRCIAEKRSRQMQRSPPPPTGFEPVWLGDDTQDALLPSSFETPNATPTSSQRDILTSTLPSSRTLQSHLNAYTSHANSLQQQSDELKARSSAMQGLYRKVVSLCTGVEEDRVEESLPALVLAVESERGGLGVREVGRVREFLRRVDGGPGGGMEGVVEG